MDYQYLEGQRVYQLDASALPPSEFQGELSRSTSHDNHKENEILKQLPEQHMKCSKGAVEDGEGYESNTRRSAIPTMSCEDDSLRIENLSPFAVATELFFVIRR
ncbi:hypothetical protein KIN20_035461 [Parelaphostrongylus tenuis]|uniref:Uncharacterized protein n=1 Tax=Parelaphostrongylus tenuis TaxID=148309 RepID=A0AAD5RBJ2_PARTN|nr:hypothetical protein KIN20_035461 [Parelaphostrongylus tenuis]